MELIHWSDEDADAWTRRHLNAFLEWNEANIAHDLRNHPKNIKNDWLPFIFLFLSNFFLDFKRDVSVCTCLFVFAF